MLIGQNDLCKLSCVHNGTLSHFGGIDGNSQPQTAAQFAHYVKKGLNVLMKGLPRTIVSLILPPVSKASTAYTYVVFFNTYDAVGSNSFYGGLSKAPRLSLSLQIHLPLC